MEKKINLIKDIKRVLIFPLFLTILISSSVSFAQDPGIENDQNLTVSATILSLTANINSERMSISYNGISNNTGLLFQMDKKSYGIEPSISSEVKFKTSEEDDSQFKFGRSLKQMTRYFLRYFNVDDFSTDDADSKSLLKGNVNINKINPNDFEFNLSLSVGADNGTRLTMDALKLESYLLRTYVNAVYHYEKNEVELGFSNAYLNEFLLEGMKLELQANPLEGSGSVFLTMSL